MALSVLASVAPLVLKDAKLPLYLSAVFAGTLVMCTTYQAASGIFPMLVAVVALRSWLDGKSTSDVAKFALLSAAAFLLAVVFFRLFIMVPVESYVDNSLPPIADLIPSAWSNIKSFWKLVVSDSKRIWLFLALLIVLSFLYISVRDAKRNNVLSFCVVCATVLVMALMSFGLYPLLQIPLTSPRAMYGVGALVAFFAVPVALAEGAVPSKLVVVAFSWTMLAFAFAYGNALYLQGQWIDFRTTMTIEELNDIPTFASPGTKEVQLSGNAGFAPALRNEIKEFPVLERLIPRTFHGDSSWGWYALLNYYGLANVQYVEPNESGENDFSKLDLPLMKESTYQDIYSDGTKYLICLR